MSEPFIAEIRIFAGNFAPRNWAFCHGDLLPVAQHTALFSLLGTTYGGDGRTTFGLPDLRNRVPMHPGRGPGRTPRRLGERGGADTHTLAPNELGNHSHNAAVFGGQGSTNAPGPGVIVAQGQGRGAAIYSDSTTTGPLRELVGVGASPAMPHDNTQPTRAMNYIIALNGLYPSRS